MNEDVFCPFRLEVPEGHSTFTVIVPRDFAQNRQFNFADLCLAPDYYNTKSAQEGMDTDQELDATTNHEIYVMAQISKNLFPQKFELKTIMPVPNFVKEINHFFENTKPEGINSSVFFLIGLTLLKQNQENQLTILFNQRQSLIMVKPMTLQNTTMLCQFQCALLQNNTQSTITCIQHKTMLKCWADSGGECGLDLTHVCIFQLTTSLKLWDFPSNKLDQDMEALNNLFLKTCQKNTKC